MQKSTDETPTSNVATQIRLPAKIHGYIRQEATRMGVSQNNFLVILLYLGKEAWEAKGITPQAED